MNEIERTGWLALVSLPASTRSACGIGSRSRSTRSCESRSDGGPADGGADTRTTWTSAHMHHDARHRLVTRPPGGRPWVARKSGSPRVGLRPNSSGRGTSYGTPLLDMFVASDPGPRILNVGASQGVFTAVLEARGYEVVARMSPRLTWRCSRVGCAARCLQADLTDLPLPDGTFDGVVAGEVLEHIEAEGQALSEVARVLRPGGVLVLSVPAHPAWFGASDRWAGHVRRYTRARGPSVLRRASPPRSVGRAARDPGLLTPENLRVLRIA